MGRIAILTLVAGLGTTGLLASMTGRREVGAAALTMGGLLGLVATAGQAMADEQERRRAGKLDGLRRRHA